MNIKDKFNVCLSYIINNRLIVHITVIVLCVIIIVIQAFSVSSVRNDWEIKTTENNSRIAELNMTISKLENSSKTMSDLDNLKVMLSKAVEAGNKVVTYQSDYWTIGTDNSDALLNNANLLDDYFVFESINARVPWFQPVSAINGSVPNLKWTFVTGLDFTDTTVNVLWLCKDSKGHVVAYTTGVYEGYENKFSNVKWTVTTYGMSNYVFAEDLTGNTGTSTGYRFDENGQLLNPDGTVYTQSLDLLEDIKNKADELPIDEDAVRDNGR